MCYSTIRNYLIKTRYEYGCVIKRRKERFIILIKLEAPISIIRAEIKLLKQPFYKFFMEGLYQKSFLSGWLLSIAIFGLLIVRF